MVLSSLAEARISTTVAESDTPDAADMAIECRLIAMARPIEVEPLEVPKIGVARSGLRLLEQLPHLADVAAFPLASRPVHLFEINLTPEQILATPRLVQRITRHAASAR